MPIPNRADSTYLDQTEIDSGNTTIWEKTDFVKLSTDGVVTAQGTPNGTVAVAAGNARIASSDKTITAGNVSVISGAANPDGSTATAADATLARFSLITLNTSSQLGVVHGTPAALSPTNDGSYDCVWPTFSGKLVLAAVFVPPTATTIASGQISDVRRVATTSAYHDEGHSIVSATSHSAGWSAKGSIPVATASTTASMLAVGTNNQVLTADSAQTTGVKWASPAATTVATDTIFDAAGDLVVGSGADTSAKLTVGTALTTRLVNTGSGVLAWTPHIARVSSDVTVNNSTVLVDATGLSFAIGANEVWWVQANIIMTGLSTVSDAKFGWTFPTSCTMTWGGNLIWQSAGVSSSISALKVQTDTIAQGSANMTYGTQYFGTVTNGANAGTIQLQFAQNTATAENTVLKANSHLILWRLA